jgi:hypothetical protein
VRGSNVGAGRDGLFRDGRLEAIAIEDEADIALGDAHSRAVRRAKDDSRYAARDPGSLNTADGRCEELRHTSRSHAFAAPDRRSNRVVPLENDNRGVWRGATRFTRGDEPARAATNDEKIAIFDAHAARPMR